MESSGKDWFAVRCIFEVYPKDRETGESGTYEERVTVWQARSFDEAIADAEADADSYAETVGSRFLGLSQAYQLDEPVGHGAEVFSLMRDSALSAADYLRAYFDTGTERQARST